MSFSACPVDILDAGEVRATIGTWDGRAYLELCLSRIQFLTSKISHICQEIRDIKSAKNPKSNFI